MPDNDTDQWAELNPAKQASARVTLFGKKLFAPFAKLCFGAGATATPVSSADPLPVAVISGGGGGGLTDAELRATPVPVSDGGGVITVDGALTAKANVAASQTQSTVVTAVSAKKIRVLAVASVCGGTATDITFLSDSTAISPLFAQGANSGVVLGYNPDGWFETTAGEALKVTTGTGSTSGILVTYCEV